MYLVTSVCFTSLKIALVRNFPKSIRIIILISCVIKTTIQKEIQGLKESVEASAV